MKKNELEILQTSILLLDKGYKELIEHNLIRHIKKAKRIKEIIEE